MQKPPKLALLRGWNHDDDDNFLLLEIITEWVTLGGRWVAVCKVLPRDFIIRKDVCKPENARGRKLCRSLRLSALLQQKKTSSTTILILDPYGLSQNCDCTTYSLCTKGEMKKTEREVRSSTTPIYILWRLSLFLTYTHYTVFENHPKCPIWVLAFLAFSAD